MSFDTKNIAFVIYDKGNPYYFYTWTSDKYFYEKKSLCVKYNGQILYIPCFPANNEILKNYSHTVRFCFNKVLYTFIGANKSKTEHKTKFSDIFNIHSVRYFSGAAWRYTENTFWIEPGSAQRIGMRYKYYIRQLTDKEANEAGYLTDSVKPNLGNVQYEGYTTFGGTKHFMSHGTEEKKYVQELVNSEKTAALIGGVNRCSWIDTWDSVNRPTLSYNPSNIACYRITSDIADGYTDLIINYKPGTFYDENIYWWCKNGVMEEGERSFTVDISY